MSLSFWYVGMCERGSRLELRHILSEKQFSNVILVREGITK